MDMGVRAEWGFGPAYGRAGFGHAEMLHPTAKPAPAAQRPSVLPVPQFKYPGPKSVLYTPYKTLFDTLLSVYDTF